MKVAKNVTFDIKNLDIIRQLMTKTGKNFSQCANYIIQVWFSMATEIKKMEEQQQIENIKQAKIIKDKPGVEK